MIGLVPEIQSFPFMFRERQKSARYPALINKHLSDLRESPMEQYQTPKNGVRRTIRSTQETPP